MEKVSVIVPIYNVKDYLERCVESILLQTEQNIRIILVDDGSTDGSQFVCDDLSKKDERITVLHKENGGLSSARNLGLQFAKGEFVCFIDSDDVVSKYYVEHLLYLNEKYGCDISVGEYTCFYDIAPNFNNNSANIEILDGKQAIRKLFGDSYVNATIACNKLYKRSLFDDLKYPEGLINEDEALAYKLYYKANKVAFSTNVLYGYYTRANSITQSRFSERNFDFLKIAWERCIFFKENKEDEYYYLFLKVYCWTLLEFSKKTRNILGKKKKSRLLIKEFREKSKLLKKSPYMSNLKKIGVELFRVFPSLYFVSTKINQRRKNK